MLTILQKLENKPAKQLHFWIVFIAILIAAQVQYIQHGWINPDSVLYLEAAKLFTKGAWQAGFDVFAWPFYALCIALVSKITTFNVHLSAQLLNVLFFAIATYSFIQIIQLAGGKQRQIIAGALIWLSAQYMIGGVLEMLMRDEGFWAFYLLSLVFFIRFYQQYQIKDVLLWQVCIIVATLFRVEAILFLMFLPLILFFQEAKTSKQKARNFVLANSINIGLAILITLIFTLNDSLSTKLLGRLNEVFTSNLWQLFTQNLSDKSRIMSSQVLGKYLEEFATPGLLLTFLYVMCAKAIGATGLINVGLSAMALKYRSTLINKKVLQVLLAAAGIAALNMALIITKVFVLSGRYVLALSFILMIFSAFYFADLFKYLSANNKKCKWLVFGFVVFMLLGTVKNILPKKAGYNYQQDAVAWIKANNTENKPVFYDETRMRYFAGLPFIAKWSKTLENFKLNGNMEATNYEYLVISNLKRHPSNPKDIDKILSSHHKVKQFCNTKKDKCVAIYKKGLNEFN